MKPRRPKFGRRDPAPSTTAELTPADFDTIRYALQRAVVEHTAANRWPAAEAAQLTLAKIEARRG